jgi:hypothetical protein
MEIAGERQARSKSLMLSGAAVLDVIGTFGGLYWLYWIQ